MRSINLCQTSFLAYIREQIFKLVFFHRCVEEPDLVSKGEWTRGVVFGFLPRSIEMWFSFRQILLETGHKSSGGFQAMPSLQSHLRCRWYHQDDFSLLFHLRRSTYGHQLLFWAASLPVSTSRLVFTASFTKVKYCVEPGCFYETFRSIQDELVGGIKRLQGLLWILDACALVVEINHYRVRSFSDASRASFAGLNFLSRNMENGFLWEDPDKNLSRPERIAFIVLWLYGFLSTFLASTSLLTILQAPYIQTSLQYSSLSSKVGRERFLE